MMNHTAIYRAYPEVVAIFDDRGAFDKDGNQAELDQAKVDAAAVIVAKEQALATAQQQRAAAYAVEADPLAFKYLRDEVDLEQWKAKINEIRARFPYPTEEVN